MAGSTGVNSLRERRAPIPGCQEGRRWPARRRPPPPRARRRATAGSRSAPQRDTQHRRAQVSLFASDHPILRPITRAIVPATFLVDPVGPTSPIATKFHVDNWCAPFRRRPPCRGWDSMTWPRWIIRTLLRRPDFVGACRYAVRRCPSAPSTSGNRLGDLGRSAVGLAHALAALLWNRIVRRPGAAPAARRPVDTRRLSRTVRAPGRRAVMVAPAHSLGPHGRCSYCASSSASSSASSAMITTPSALEMFAAADRVRGVPMTGATATKMS